MSRRKKISIVTIAALVTIPLVCYSLPYKHRRDGCIQCRLVKRADSYCGISITREIPNECSRWYVQAHPDHKHEWAKGVCTYSRLGLSRKWSCGRELNVFYILPEMQKAFLSSCTPEQERQWFELLASRRQEDFEKAQKMATDAFFGQASLNSQALSGTPADNERNGVRESK